MSTGESTAQAPLNMAHYRAVRKALWKVRPQWRNIGLELGIPPYKLNEFSGSLEERMDKMLEVWLNQTYSTPTWGALVDALRDVTVGGGNPVAAEIEANYIGGGQSVAVNPSLEDILKDVPPEKLDQPCRDEHLSDIALSITEWKSIAPFLGLTKAEEENIEKDCAANETQKIGMLQKWREKLGRKATYGKLIKVFWKLKRADLVEEVCELLQTESSSSSSEEEGPPAAKRSQRGTKGSYAKHFRRGHAMKLSARDKVVGSVVTMDGTSSQATQPKQRNCETQKNGLGFQKFRKKPFGKRKSVLYPHTGGPQAAKRSQKGILDSYAEYLRGRYSTEPPKFFTLQWPPPPTDKVFNLAMIKQQTIRRGPVDDELVRLTLRGNVDDIMERKTEVKLENIFNLNKKKRKVILIEGAPGAGKSTLAWHICQTWESGELFQEFRVVIFVQLRDPAIQSARSLADILPVESENMRSEVMSEIQSCRGRNVLFILDGWDEYGPGLQHSSLFQQLICTPGEVNMHFSSLIITSRPIASGELQQYASSRVEIVGFTSTEVKKYFSESIGDAETEQKLQDHLRERPVIEASCYLPLNAAIIVHLFLALNHTLPHTFQEMFLSLILCCIIRHLTKEGGRPHISSLDDLPPDVQEPFKNICTMAYHGVMKNKVTFSAAYLQSFNLPTELSTLSLIQGVQSFTAFDTSVSYNFLHLSVQELLAAFHISKLSASEQIRIFNDFFDQPRLAAVFRFYAAFTKLQTEGVRDIVARIILKEKEIQRKGNETIHKPLLVNLLHGLYEAQDPSLCQFVASHLKGELDLRGNTLSPMDCLVVGYFLSCVCNTTSGKFIVDLSRCSLDDYRVSFLMRELSKCSSSTDVQEATTGDGIPGHLSMYLKQNKIQKKGGKAIGDALMVIEYLSLANNQQFSTGVVHIVESLKVNKSLLRFYLDNCNISDVGAVHIADGLRHNNCLKRLGISECGLGDCGMKPLASALEINTSLEFLNLSGNRLITSIGLLALGESLKRNMGLKELWLWDLDTISDDDWKQFGLCLRENNHLTELCLTVRVNYDQVNDIRREKNLPLLKVKNLGLSLAVGEN